MALSSPCSDTGRCACHSRCRSPARCRSGTGRTLGRPTTCWDTAGSAPTHSRRLGTAKHRARHLTTRPAGSTGSRQLTTRPAGNTGLGVFRHPPNMEGRCFSTVFVPGIPSFFPPFHFTFEYKAHTYLPEHIGTYYRKTPVQKNRLSWLLAPARYKPYLF